MTLASAGVGEKSLGHTVLVSDGVDDPTLATLVRHSRGYHHGNDVRQEECQRHRRTKLDRKTHFQVVSNTETDRNRVVLNL